MRNNRVRLGAVFAAISIEVVFFYTGIGRAEMAHPTMFLDYSFEATTQPKLALNPLDLPETWGTRPFSSVTKGSHVYLWAFGRSFDVRFEYAEINKQWPRHRGGVVVHLAGAETVPSGFLLLSLNPLPPQKWELFVPSDDHKRALRTAIGTKVELSWKGIRTKEGEFILVQHSTDQEGEFVQWRSVVFKRKNKKEWEKSDEFFNDGGPADPMVDTDGDGVPELVRPTDYKSYRLRKIFPEPKDVLVNNSGV